MITSIPSKLSRSGEAMLADHGDVAHLEALGWRRTSHGWSYGLDERCVYLWRSLAPGQNVTKLTGACAPLKGE